MRLTNLCSLQIHYVLLHLDMAPNSALTRTMCGLMQAIIEESHSESKWKQLGELAMSAGKEEARLK